MSSPSGARVLVARGVDGLLVGWLAVFVWFGGLLFAHRGISLGVDLAPAVYWVGAIVSSAHFGLSYHLAYREGWTAVHRRPIPLPVGPLVLGVALLGVALWSLQAGSASTRTVTSAMITVVYLLTTWHYIKQAYGVARVGAAFGGMKLTRVEGNVLRYALYPLWALGSAQVLVKGRGYTLSGYRVGFAVLPPHTLAVLRVVGLLGAIPVLVVFHRLWRRHRRLPPSVLVAPYAAAFLWLALPVSPLLTVLLLAPFHAMQYLAVGHRAEVALAADGPAAHGLFWWLNIFAGATCGGLLLGRWLPNLLDAHLHPATGGPFLFAATFFVFLNLHHYLIDASIWRSKGELIKAMARPPAPRPTPDRELVSP